MSIRELTKPFFIKGRGVDIMKRKILIVLTIITMIMISCTKESKKIRSSNGGISGEVGYIPVATSKPSDAEELKKYRISLEGLDGHSIYAVATNQLVYHDRYLDVYFDGNVLGNELSTIRESVVENEEKIIPFRMELPIPDEWTEKDEVEKNFSIVKSSYSVGSTRTFNVYKMPEEKLAKVNTTLRKRNTVGNRSVNVWVEDSVWNGNVYEKTKINQSMVDELANQFLSNGTTDIYSTITNIYGQEYYEGNSSYVELIDGTKEIDIVLFNLHDYYSGGRILGYFNSLDLFRKTVGMTNNSNESLAFYLDAYSLADSESGAWNKDDYWPEATISTLAHEFTHLVIFYQHMIQRKASMSRWLNEMLAMLSEDIVSNTTNLKGPRGIVGSDLSSDNNYTDRGRGRLPLANAYNNFPVNDYYMASYINYAVTYSYGAFLLRNFGRGSNGLKVFRDIVWNDKNDMQAIEYALKENGYNYSFVDTISMWGKASTLSKEVFTGTELYKLDNGSNGFDMSIDSNTYKLGSINLYNYSISPTMYGVKEKNIPNLSKASTLLFNLQNNISGSYSVNLTLPNYVKVEFIVLDKNGKYDIKKTGTIDVRQID